MRRAIQWLPIRLWVVQWQEWRGVFLCWVYQACSWGQLVTSFGVWLTGAPARRCCEVVPHSLPVCCVHFQGPLWYSWGPEQHNMVRCLRQGPSNHLPLPSPAQGAEVAVQKLHTGAICTLYLGSPAEPVHVPLTVPPCEMQARPLGSCLEPAARTAGGWGSLPAGTCPLGKPAAEALVAKASGSYGIACTSMPNVVQASP